MYKLTMILFALFSLVLPILAVPVPASNAIDGMEKRGTNTGKGTWYYPGLGSCGGTNNQGQSVVAVSHDIASDGAHCGKNVRITYNGKSTSAQVVDTCESCGPSDLDLSPDTFEKLAPLSQGVMSPMTWEFY